MRKLINNEEKKNAKVIAQIHPFGKSSDSPGDFGFKRTGKINFRVISKNCMRKALARPFGLAECECAHANKK